MKDPAGHDKPPLNTKRAAWIVLSAVVLVASGFLLTALTSVPDNVGYRASLAAGILFGLLSLLKLRPPESWTRKFAANADLPRTKGQVLRDRLVAAFCVGLVLLAVAGFIWFLTVVASFVDFYNRKS